MSQERLNAAENVCWSVLLMMGIGELQEIPLGFRPVIADPMQKWADLAHRDGMLGDPQAEKEIAGREDALAKIAKGKLKKQEMIELAKEWSKE